MTVSNKKIKKAIYRLKVDGNTPLEVIDFIGKQLLSNNIKKESIINQQTINSNDKFINYNSTLDSIMKDIVLDYTNPRFDIRTYERFCKGYKNLTNLTFKLSINDLNYIVKYIKQNLKLQAIKHYKDITNFGLKESKDFIDMLSRHIIHN